VASLILSLVLWAFRLFRSWTGGRRDGRVRVQPTGLGHERGGPAAGRGSGRKDGARRP